MLFRDQFKLLNNDKLYTIFNYSLFFNTVHYEYYNLFSVISNIIRPMTHVISVVVYGLINGETRQSQCTVNTFGKKVQKAIFYTN